MEGINSLPLAELVNPVSPFPWQEFAHLMFPLHIHCKSCSLLAAAGYWAALSRMQSLLLPVDLQYEHADCNAKKAQTLDIPCTAPLLPLSTASSCSWVALEHPPTYHTRKKWKGMHAQLAEYCINIPTKQVLNTLATTAASFSNEMSFRAFFNEGTTFFSCKSQIRQQTA